jgi:transcriptional regulator with XRE-family HTH domain
MKVKQEKIKPSNELLEENDIAKLRNEYRIAISSTLKYARQDHELSQTVVANALLTSQNQLSRYELGMSALPCEIMIDYVTRVLGLEVVIRNPITHKEKIKFSPLDL